MLPLPSAPLRILRPSTASDAEARGSCPASSPKPPRGEGAASRPAVRRTDHLPPPGRTAVHGNRRCPGAGLLASICALPPRPKSQQQLRRPISRTAPARARGRAPRPHSSSGSGGGCHRPCCRRCPATGCGRRSRRVSAPAPRPRLAISANPATWPQPIDEHQHGDRFQPSRRPPNSPGYGTAPRQRRAASRRAADARREPKPTQERGGTCSHLESRSATSWQSWAGPMAATPHFNRRLRRQIFSKQ